MKYFKTKIGLIIAVLTIGIFAVALAQSGNGTSYGGYTMGPGMMGYGNGMMGYGNGMMGYGNGMMGYGMGYNGHMMGYGPNGYANLSSEDVARLQQAQQKFFNDTQELRNEIQQKGLALNQELQKTTPDRDKAVTLEKELSNLQSQLNEKGLEYRLDLRKEFPGTALGSGYGYGGGYCW